MNEIYLLRKEMPDQGFIKGEVVEENDYSKAINRVSVVMLCSFFQGYVQEVSREFLDRLNGSVKCHQLPDRLKVTLCSEIIPDYFGNDPETLATKLPLFISKNHFLWTSRGKLGSSHFDYRCKKNWETKLYIGDPGSKVLLRHFRRLGIDDVWEEIQVMSGKVDLDGRLDEVVHQRNNIAHSLAEVYPTTSEVSGYIDSIKEIVNSIDNIILNYYNKLAA